MPNALLKKMLRIIISLALNILRHCKANRTGVGRVCKHAHCVEASGHKLFWAIDSVKIVANTLECIGNRSAIVIKKFCLLKNRVGLTASKCVAGENKKRNSVSRCTAAGGNHICCARTD